MLTLDTGADPNAVRQLGIVVKDLDKAIGHWSGVLGFGPFVVIPELTISEFRYRGREAAPPVLSIALGHQGALQAELIQQRNDSDSAFRDFLKRGQEGVQHLSGWCASRAEYDQTYAGLLSKGLDLVHEGLVQGRSGPSRFAYFTGADGSWPQMEISEALLPGSMLHTALERLNAEWDGRTPIVGMDVVARAGSVPVDV